MTIFCCRIAPTMCTFNIFCVSVCSSDVLLDMKTSGGDLGWLPSPSEEGVSVHGLGDNPRLFTHLLGFSSLTFILAILVITVLLISPCLFLTFGI